MTPASHQDTRLRWTMRVIGLLLAAICTFLLTSDVVRSDEAVAFLGVAAGLGTMTFISSWFHSSPEPAPERVRS